MSPFKFRKQFSLLDSLVLIMLFPAFLFADSPVPIQAGSQTFQTDFSGYIKTLNFLTKTSGSSPEFVDNGIFGKENTNVFHSLERFRLQTKTTGHINDNSRLVLKLTYDHIPYFGTFVSAGDFRIAKRQSEERQFLDLSQTLIEADNVFYEHRLYRASLSYESERFDLEIGRQQIPWGVGHFFTPTDLLNPFSPTQIELDERDGVDAVNLTIKNIRGLKTQFVYTPPGKQLHPQRYLARISRDVKNYEVGIIGGRTKRDHVFGLDIQGNLRESAIRGEFLYQEAELEKDFIKFTVNADYNFPKNVYGLVEYHFNSQGRRDPDDYQIDRLIRGDIYELGRQYLAGMLGYDLTDLIRFEYRVISNLHDGSFFMRPELQYEFMTNVLITIGAQLFLGSNQDEYGRPKNLFFGELKYKY